MPSNRGPVQLIAVIGGKDCDPPLGAPLWWAVKQLNFDWAGSVRLGVDLSRVRQADVSYFRSVVVARGLG
jgi:hypothetical protein